MPEVYIIPEPTQVILQLIATLLMFIAVKVFFWKPITQFIEQKREISIAEINEAKARNHEAQVLLDEANETVKQARLQAQDIVMASKVSANNVHDGIIKAAKKEADYLKTNAKEIIELERVNFYNTLKSEVADLAIVAASKIVEEELDIDKHKSIIESSIDGVIQ